MNQDNYKMMFNSYNLIGVVEIGACVGDGWSDINGNEQMDLRDALSIVIEIIKYGGVTLPNFTI